MNIIPTTPKNDYHINDKHPIIEDCIKIEKQETNIEGLTCRYIYTENNDLNNSDCPWYPVTASQGMGNHNIRTDFSLDNQNIILEYLENIMRKKDKIIIIEIGVSRDSNFENTSTYILTKYKRKQDIYIGIDVDDKTHLNNIENNIHTIRSPSENIEYIMNYIHSLGIETFDIFMVDGNHSLNQVYKEWEYTKYLNKNGIVIFHDTNAHPGPYFITKSIDTNLYEVNKYFNDIVDWGLTVAIRK